MWYLIFFLLIGLYYFKNNYLTLKTRQDCCPTERIGIAYCIFLSLFFVKEIEFVLKYSPLVSSFGFEFTHFEFQNEVFFGLNNGKELLCT